MAQKPERPMPKKKGGAMFPRVHLQDAAGYARKLVTKTHTGAQKPDILLPGVFDSKGSRGQIRASAMKQYGLMNGSAKNGYEASGLAKDLVHATVQDKQEYLQKAALSPKLFKGLYETFKGDRVSVGKIRQQAANLNVHPDNVDKCTDLFIESLVFAGLAERAGDEVVIGSQRSHGNISEVTGSDSTDHEGSASVVEGESGESEPDLAEGERRADTDDRSQHERARAVINVNVSLDSSLDTEKLERQLELLKRYGAL